MLFKGNKWNLVLLSLVLFVAGLAIAGPTSDTKEQDETRPCKHLDFTDNLGKCERCCKKEGSIVLLMPWFRTRMCKCN